MDRPDLELILAIRQHGTLAAAARTLGLAAPAVTKRLAALESRLGLRLFQRSTRRVSPTAESEVVYDRASELLRGFEALESELRERRSEPAGPIRLAATFGFGRQWVGPAVAAFQQRHPAISVQLQLTEQLPDLAVEGYDGAIWLWSAPAQRANEWVSRRLARNQRVLVAAPNYLKRHGTPGTPQDLTSHQCLVVRENGGADDRRFDHWRLHPADASAALHVQVRGPLSSNSGELVRDWCLAGQGIMLRSLWDIAPQLASGKLVRVLSGWSMPDADIHWLAPHQARVPRRIQLLLEHLATQFRGEPWRLRPVLAPAPPDSRQKR